MQECLIRTRGNGDTDRERARKIWLRFGDGHRFSTELVAFDPGAGLALLRVGTREDSYLTDSSGEGLRRDMMGDATVNRLES